MTALASDSPLAVICSSDKDKADAEKPTPSAENELGVPISKQTAFGTISVDPAMKPLRVDHSYLEVHQSFYQRASQYTQKFKEHVLQYVIDWDASVSTRVNAGLKELEKQRLDLEHYSRKVELMRLAVNKTIASGKTVSDAAGEKLKRNEMKLLHAKQNYETHASSFALLISEVTERAWKDLHPLLVKLVQFDSTLAADEGKFFAQLNEATSVLKQIGTDNSLGAKGRLLSIQTLRPEELFTGDTTNPFGRRQMIEAGPGFVSPDLTACGSSFSTGSLGGAYTSTSENEWSSNPSPAPFASAPGGGNFYDPFASSGNISTNMGQKGNSSSFTGASAGWSQVDMLNLAASAAPPPTLSDINEATGSLTISSNQSSHQWGNDLNTWPSLQPQQQAANPFSSSSWHKSESGASWHSATPAFAPSQSLGGYSLESSFGPVAPAPCAAPPPLPPPPAFSMYGNTSSATAGGSSFGHDIFSPPAAPPASYNLMGGSGGGVPPMQQRHSVTSNPFDY